MSRSFVVCPEAQALYDQTIARAVARRIPIVGIETSSRQESIDQINNAFWAAASVNETAAGEVAPEERRTLDLAEARLAIVSLNVAADGDRAIAANEGRSAYDRLQGTIRNLPGDNWLGRNPAELLMAQCAARGRGWRRIPDSATQRDIRANFRSEGVTSLDTRPGMDAVDAVFAAYVYNSQVGGSNETIGFSDAMSASSLIEMALRGLTTYYSS